MYTAHGGGGGGGEKNPPPPPKKKKKKKKYEIIFKQTIKNYFQIDFKIILTVNPFGLRLN